MTPSGRIGGKTPERLVKLVSEAVSKSSQSAVARESGVALLTIQRCLKGVGEPTGATLEKLATFFGVTVAWLRGEGVFPRLSALVKAAIEEKGTAKIEEDTGISQILINRLASGIGEPNLSIVDQLADYFKVGIEWLKGDSRFWPKEMSDDINFSITASKAFIEDHENRLEIPIYKEEVEYLLHHLFVISVNYASAPEDNIMALDFIEATGLYFEHILNFRTQPLGKSGSSREDNTQNPS